MSKSQEPGSDTSQRCSYTPLPVLAAARRAADELFFSSSSTSLDHGKRRETDMRRTATAATAASRYRQKQDALRLSLCQQTVVRSITRPRVDSRATRVCCFVALLHDVLSEECRGGANLGEPAIAAPVSGLVQLALRWCFAISTSGAVSLLTPIHQPISPAVRQLHASKPKRDMVYSIRRREQLTKHRLSMIKDNHTRARPLAL